MADLLTPEDAAEADKLGWKVIQTFDLTTRRMVPCLIATGPDANRWHRDTLLARITTLARSGSHVARETLRALSTAPRTR